MSFWFSELLKNHNNYIAELKHDEKYEPELVLFLLHNVKPEKNRVFFYHFKHYSQEQKGRIFLANKERVSFIGRYDTARKTQ